MAVALSIMSIAGPVVPTGKKMSGSEARQAESSRQSVTVNTVVTPTDTRVLLSKVKSFTMYPAVSNDSEMFVRMLPWKCMKPSVYLYET